MCSFKSSSWWSVMNLVLSAFESASSAEIQNITGKVFDFKTLKCCWNIKQTWRTFGFVAGWSFLRFRSKKIYIVYYINVAVFTHLTPEQMRKNLKQKLFLNSSFSLLGAVMMLLNNQVSTVPLRVRQSQEENSATWPLNWCLIELLHQEKVISVSAEGFMSSMPSLLLRQRQF